MNLLAIDTATEACSVAIWQDGAILERFEVAGREASQRLPDILQALLADAGLRLTEVDGIACGVGPGSFAGVRVGVSFVKGLALGLDRPVLGVSSLAMLAEPALAAQGGTVLAAIDARMGEVYFGVYASDGPRITALLPERVCAPADASLAGSAPWHALGSGWAAHGVALRQALGVEPASIDPSALPHASAALRLVAQEFLAGRGQRADALVPVYLRNRVALTRVEQQALRAESSRSSP